MASSFISMLDVTSRDVEKDLLLISDPVCAKFGMKACFSSGVNSLYITAGKGGHCHAESTENTNVSSCPVLIHQLEQEDKPWTRHPVMKKLLFASRDIFVKIQKHPRSDSDTNEIWRNFSAEYRCCIKACFEEVEKLRGKESESARHGDHVYFSKLLFEIHIIWHLCEIMLLERFAAGDIVKHLLVWLRWHVGDAGTQATHLLNLGEPEKHKEYWSVVFALVLQGHVSTACELLSRHTEASAFQQLLALMENMPFWKLHKNYSLTEFNYRWRAWKQQVYELHESAVFSGYPQLDTLCRILAGDEAVFSSVMDVCQTWYHLLVSKMLYCHPTVSADDLAQYAKICMRQFYGSSGNSSFSSTSNISVRAVGASMSMANESSSGAGSKQLDKLLLTVLEQDGEELFKECCSQQKNWWLVVHLSDLLYHTMHTTTSTNLTFREHFILEFASNLSSSPSCFATALTYLQHCPIYGESYTSTLLEHQAPGGHRAALRLVDTCKKLGVGPVAGTVCRQMAMHSLQASHTGTALMWGLASKEERLVSKMATRYMQDYLDKGQFQDVDLLDHLQANMLYSDTLTFLGEYRRFHRLMENEEWGEAGQLLISLTSLAQPKFQMMLLVDALDLLGLTDKLIFDESQTYELMKVLEDMSQQEAYPTLLYNEEKMEQMTGHKEKIDSLREALVHNLARAAVERG